MNRQPHTLRFGAFEADLRSRELWKRGVRVSLQEQPFQVLAALLERSDQLVTREELQDLLWPDVIVDKEVGLNNAVRKLRDALGDSVDDPHFIETLKGRGYRFLVEVSSAENASPPPREPQVPPKRVPWLARILAIGIPIALVLGAILVWQFRGNDFSNLDASDLSILLVPLEVSADTDLELHTGRLFAEGVAIALASEGSVRVFPVPAHAASSADGALALAKSSSRAIPKVVMYGSLTRKALTTTVSLTLIDTEKNRVLWGTQEEIKGAGQLSRFASSTVEQVLTVLGVQRTMQYDYFRNIHPGEIFLDWPPLQTAMQALRDHDIDKGLPLTEELLRKYPQEHQAHRMRVVALVDALNMKHTEEAALSLKAALEALARLDGQDPLPDLLLGWLAREQQDAEKAFSLSEPLVSRTDVTPACKAYILRGHSMNLLALDREEEALTMTERALDLDPANSWNYVYSARVLSILGRHEKALLRVRTAVAIDPFHTEELAWRYEDIEQWDKAADAYRRACEQQPDSRTCANYARVLLFAGRETEARRAGQAAEELERTGPGNYALACYWALAGESETAVDFLRQASDLGYKLDRIMKDADLNSLHNLPAFQDLLVAHPSASR